MNKALVSIIRVSEYDLTQIYTAVKHSIELIGTPEKLIPRGSKVFLKINNLCPSSPPETGIVTHPVFVEAVIKYLKEFDVDITVGDDVDSTPPDAFEISGFRQMCDRAGVKLLNLRENGFEEVNCDGQMLTKVYIARAVRESDLIINLPKLKTHSLCLFTGGVKNMYGVIPSGMRRKFHAGFPNRNNFARMLVDIYSAAIPRLNIMDGIIAMEGEGPAAGNLRNLGIILSSRDAVALDAVASQIAGMEPFEVATTLNAHERGYGIGDIKSIEVAGEKIESVVCKDFKRPSSTSRIAMGKTPKFITRFIMHQLEIKPYAVNKLCTGCGECIKDCPVQAISLYKEKAKIDKHVCIQCMCCHEVCRNKSIVLKQSVFGKIIRAVYYSSRKKK
ncbi:MAG: DUF362 domain-containing protein [Chloroflexi bacterium]|nr:DUF362 domain-containing protein [Chloroflexota bacterium]